MSSSTAPAPARKAADQRPPKPYPDFPLYPHLLGYWSKKINTKIYHFGRWGRVVNGVLTRVKEDGDWTTALQLYEARKEALYAGREPRARVVNGKVEPGDEVLTVKTLCNEFLTAKKVRHGRGKLTTRSFDDYHATAQRLAAVFGSDCPVDGLGPKDFNRLLASISAGVKKAWGAIRVGNEITRVKSVFKYGIENGLITKPIPYGSEFKKPDREEMRKEKNGRPKKMFEADELRKLLDAASPAPRAMILLGLNCGFGNHDVAILPEERVDLKAGVVDFPRPKTGIDRRCPLWPETVTALRDVLATRPAPTTPEARGLVFYTRNGRGFLAPGERNWMREVSNLMRQVGIHKQGRGFYTLRHVFRTIADEVPDRAAIDRIMGHADHTMGGHYTERISDVRLKAVTDHVRARLFGKEGGAV